MEGGGGNNWRPPQQQQQQQNPDEPSLSVPMEAAASNHEWQSQLPPEARQRIVSKIMDTLKRHLPISAPEGLGELQKIAVRFEEKIYNAATSQADYLRKISMKMLTMEQKNPNTSVSNPVSTNSNIGQGSPDAVPLDSTAQTTQIGADVQEEVYQKIKSMKEVYFPALQEMHQKMVLKLQQHEGLVLPPKQSELLENLKELKTTIERTMQIFLVQKTSITAGLKEKLPFFEKQINNLVNKNRKKHASHAQGQQFQQPGTISQPMQQQSSQVTQLQQTDALTNPAQQMSMPMTVALAQSTAVSNIQSGSIPPTSLVSAHSTAQNIDASQGSEK